MSIRGFNVSSGSVRIPVYHTVRLGYHSFTVAWRVGAKRERKKFSDPKKARAFAQDLADRLASGRSGQQTLTDAQQNEYIEAKAIAGEFSLIDCAREFVERRQTAPARSIADAVRDFLEFKRALPRRRPLQADYLRNLAQRLDAIAAVFPISLHDLRADAVQAWVNGLPGSLRTKNNYLADLRMLVNHAKRQRWLSPTFDELDRVHLERAGPGEIQPYTPEEIARLLKHFQQHAPRWLPWLPVRAFSGIRAAESLRLTPAHFHATGWIACDAGITKTERRRLIPILPNLRAWLKAYPPADQLAPIADPASLTPRLTELIQAAGVVNRHNGFRDSFASYRLAIVQDAAKVAEETGHDPRQLRRSYREIRLPDSRIITPQLAKRYFSIVPKSLK